MEPIISPVVIYLFSILAKLNMVALAVMIFSWVIIFMVGMYKFTFDDMDVKFSFKNAIIVAVIATIIVIFIPDEKTMLAMLTVSFITPDNIVITENHVVDLITKIMDAVNNVKS